MDDYRQGVWQPLPTDLVDDWQRLLSRPQHFSDHICDEVFTTSLFPLQRQAEMRQMRRLICERIPLTRSIIDVGSDKGGGVYHWCEWFPSLEKMIVIEPRGTPYAPLFEKAFPSVRFLWITASSHSAATQRTVKEFLGDDKLDIAFIDGDKTATRRDFDTYAPMMRQGGCVLIHDINLRGHPQDTFRELSATHEHHAIIDLSELPPDYKSIAPTTAPRFPAYDQWLKHWGDTSAGVGVLYITGENCNGRIHG